MEQKPVVHYIGEPLFIIEGQCAYARVQVLDHPRLGAGEVKTSRIMKEIEEGCFETLNTIYKKAV